MITHVSWLIFRRTKCAWSYGTVEEMKFLLPSKPRAPVLPLFLYDSWGDDTHSHYCPVTGFHVFHEQNSSATMLLNALHLVSHQTRDMATISLILQNSRIVIITRRFFFGYVFSVFVLSHSTKQVHQCFQELLLAYYNRGIPVYETMK